MVVYPCVPVQKFCKVQKSGLASWCIPSGVPPSWRWPDPCGIYIQGGNRGNLITEVIRHACFPTMFIFGWTLPKPIVFWHWKAPRMMFFFVKIVRRSLYFSKKLFASKLYLPIHPTSLVIFFKFQVWWSLRRWPSSWIASCYWWSSPGPCGWHHDNSTWRVSACDGNLWSKRWDHQCTGGWWPFSSRWLFCSANVPYNNSSGTKNKLAKKELLESDWGNSDICLHCLWAP